jgi:hypothetical protein
MPSAVPVPRREAKTSGDRFLAGLCIHDRPPEVEERLAPGHWKSGLIKGALTYPLGWRYAGGAHQLVTVPFWIGDAGAQAALSRFSHVLTRIEAPKRLSSVPGGSGPLISTFLHLVIKTACNFGSKCIRGKIE